MGGTMERKFLNFLGRMPFYTSQDISGVLGRPLEELLSLEFAAIEGQVSWRAPAKTP